MKASSETDITDEETSAYLTVCFVYMFISTFYDCLYHAMIVR